MSITWKSEIIIAEETGRPPLDQETVILDTQRLSGRFAASKSRGAALRPRSLRERLNSLLRALEQNA